MLMHEHFVTSCICPWLKHVMNCLFTNLEPSVISFSLYSLWINKKIADRKCRFWKKAQWCGRPCKSFSKTILEAYVGAYTYSMFPLSSISVSVSFEEVHRHAFPMTLFLLFCKEKENMEVISARRNLYVGYLCRYLLHLWKGCGTNS